MLDGLSWTDMPKQASGEGVVVREWEKVRNVDDRWPAALIS